MYIVGTSDQNPFISNSYGNYNDYGILWKNGQAMNLIDNDSSVEESHFTVGRSIAVSGSDIYVAGYTGHGQKWVFTLWKNNHPVTLPLPDENFSVSTDQQCSIAVSGSDVYVAATVHKMSAVPKGRVVYWKNNRPIYITDGSKEAYATGIAVLGNDVYISGSESNGAHFVAKYWKNGKVVELSNGSQDAFANGIVVLP